MSDIKESKAKKTAESLSDEDNPTSAAEYVIETDNMVVVDSKSSASVPPPYLARVVQTPSRGPQLRDFRGAFNTGKMKGSGRGNSRGR